jgi:hypothetical protein
MGPLHGRLLNTDGELIAEGPCWLDEEVGQATMEPSRAPGVIQKERGRLALELESGRSYGVSDKPMIVRLGSNGHGPDRQRRKLYKLQLIDHGSGNEAQEAGAAGAAGKGQPASDLTGLRVNGETPAAR